MCCQNIKINKFYITNNIGFFICTSPYNLLCSWKGQQYNIVSTLYTPWGTLVACKFDSLPAYYTFMSSKCSLFRISGKPFDYVAQKSSCETSHIGKRLFKLPIESHTNVCLLEHPSFCPIYHIHTQGCYCQGKKSWKLNFFPVGEKSGNFIFSQGN